MACDVVPHDPNAFTPRNLQVADPIRPRVAVSAGPGHSRWEFMRMPPESADGFNSVETAWRLLGLFGVTPEWGVLSRHAAYRFAARNAQRWRVNRVLLAGDAAHQMPPFAGQGMCTGFRDAANMAWKLDLVLRGIAAEHILDTYESECRAQAQAAIDLSVGLGRLICLTDPAAAAQRDVVMRSGAGVAAAGGQQPGDLRVTGFVHRAAEPSVGSAGVLTPQGAVAWRGRTGLFDEIAGGGFVLLSAVDLSSALNARARTTLDRLGVRVRPIVPVNGTASSGVEAVADADGVYLPWLAAMDAVAVLIRPDFYVYGTARDPESLTLMIKQLDADLHPSRSTARRVV
jgi:flavoprotein hydroxylase